MAQNYAQRLTETSLTAQRLELQNNDEALRSMFSGPSFPTTPPPVDGQPYFDADKKTVWIYDQDRAEWQPYIRASKRIDLFVPDSPYAMQAPDGIITGFTDTDDIEIDLLASDDFSNGELTVVKTHPSNDLIIDASGNGEVINGAASITLTEHYESVTLKPIPDGFFVKSWVKPSIL